MFGCIYQLWDWLEAPPLFTSATMDAKKLQQLQQANAQKKIPLAYQTNLTDYRTATQSPVFHQQQQAAVAAAYHHMQFVGGGYQQSPTATSSSGGGPLTPIEMQPHANKLLLKHHIGSGGGGTTSNSSHSSPYHQSYSSGEQQLYQSPNERTYLAAAGRLQSTTSQNPATALQAQYQQLQQAKMQLQMQTQNDAMQQQQRTFAMRQALNPPIPQGHYHMSQSSSMMSSVTLQSQLQLQQQQQQQQQHHQQQQQQQQQQAAQHQRAPPSTLNLASQFQPATGPLKVNPQMKNQQQAHYHPAQHQQQLEQQAYAQQQLQLQLQLQHQHQLQPQQQQRLKVDTQTPGSEQSPVYIQQNHPGHVVNQACQTQISAVKPGGALVVQKSTPSSEDSSATSKSPSHAALDRKKSTSSSQALKSPVTKRPTTSPVTLSGWLYKQGSDGLKVWRKRWFVLAEYCLYYYKGPEEEKLLGSILLPSYKVSACSPEDKIYRKFAFKCEHTNMRTYWLAAESAESMIQWVRALTAATMMQAPSSGGESDQMSQPSGSSSLNHSGENSDSGIHTLQSKQSNMSQGQITPASDNGAAGNAQPSGGSGQPLYANAPPKPRRINDGGYSSPSPEHSIDNERKTQTQLMQHQRKQHLQQQQKLQQQQQQQQQKLQQQQQSNSSRRSGIMSPTLQQMQQQQQRSQQPQQHHAIYDARTGNVSSALRLQQAQQQYSVDNLEAKYQKQMTLNADDFPKSPPGGDMLGNYMEMEEQIMRLQQQQQQQQSRPDEIYGERELYMQKLIQQRYPGHLGNYPMAADRRTPDAYGRSKNRIYSDYEDIYNMSQLAGSMGLSAQEALLQEAASYRRPMSPPSYDGSKHVPAMPSRYTPNMLEPTTAGSSINLRGRSSTNLVRPHSADFLEYEARAEAAAAANVANALNANPNVLKTDAMRAPRPKSSLDINRSSDSYYYSEASYAEKMRKSALYLQHPQNQNSAQPQQAAAYRSTADISATNPFGSGMHTIAGYENPYERANNKRAETLNSALGAAQSTASMPRMSRAAAAAAGLTPSASSSHIRSASVHPASPSKQATSPSFYTPAMSTAQIIQQNEQFLRSASARLPKRSGGFDDETRTTSPPGTSTSGQTQQDGERKREESMKRLLEWKQRMLQSPLTRKGALQAQAGGSNMSAMAKLGSNPNILLSSTTVASGAHYGPQAERGSGKGGNTLVGGVAGIKRSRSETHANAGPTAGYNSYSSDDEEEGSNSKSPAGRLNSNSTSAEPVVPTAAANQDTNNSGSNGSNNDSNNTNISSNNAQAGECNETTTTATATIVETTKANSLKALQFCTTNKSNHSENSDVIRSSTTNPTKILKPILKTTERGSRSNSATPVNTMSPTIKKGLEQRPSLRLNIGGVSKEQATESVDDIAPSGITPEVSILPKKPAPKSPQNIFYTPVYSLKTLPGSTPTKNYENVEIVAIETKIDVSTAATEEEVDADDEGNNQPIGAETLIETPATDFDAESMPMLKGLQEFKQAQMLQTSDGNSKAANESNIEMEEIELEAVDEEEDDENNCEYTDDDLDEALAEEVDADAETQFDENQLLQYESSQIYENALKQNMPSEENHYLPMTPKRVDASAAAKSYLSLLTMHDSNGEDENPYVEMCKNLQQADDDKSNYEEMCLMSTEAGTSVNFRHHSKFQQAQAEPVYMELASALKPNSSSLSNETKAEEPHTSSGKSTLKKNNKKNNNDGTLKKKSKKCANKRKDLPDILKASQNTLKAGSDSSDADDESSKQVDAKKLRSRSRFSLSDTFRPASYYLGATPPLNDSIESSDNEIVAAAPPVPASPPPLEELKTEEIFLAENYDTVKRRDSSSGKFNTSYEQLPKIHASNTSLNLAKPETVLKSSRLSLPDQFSRASKQQTKSTPRAAAGGHMLLKHQHERTLSDSNYSFQTDNSSNTSSDFDLYNRLKKHSPSFVSSPARYQSSNSLTLRYTSNAPLGLTGDSSETDSVEFRQRQSSDSELERQRSRRPLSEESISEIESLNEKFEDATYTPDLDQYLNQLQASDCYVYKHHNNSSAVEATVPNTLLTNIIKPPKIFRTKNDAHLYGNMHFVSSTDSLQFTGSDSRAEGSQASLYGAGAASLTPTKYMTPMHSRNNSNISEQSAPYYYSEIDSGREGFSTPTTLNNQRDIHVHTGSNIAHIHNPIERHQFNMQTLADKDQAIDSKNIYQMKANVEKLSYSTTKNLKTGEPFQHQHQHSDLQQQLQQRPEMHSGFYLQQLASPALKLSNFDRNLHTPLRSSTPTTSTTPRPSTSKSAAATTQHHIDSATKHNNIQLAGNKVRLDSSCGVGVGNVTDNLTTVRSGPSNMLGAPLGATPKSTPESLANVASYVNKSKFSVLGAATATNETITANTSSNSSNTAAAVAGELLWEEDTLWRESLRRVSQRHARSLDDLDRIAPTPKKLIVMQQGHGQQRQSKPKITRDVTYVNDDVLRLHNKNARLNVSAAAHKSHNHDDVDDDALNENDVYVQLMSNENQDAGSDVYEVLQQEEETGSNISHKSAELDRETIRQWDSMSSGLMKNAGCHNNTEAPLSISMNVIESNAAATNTVKSIIKQWNTNASGFDDGNGNLRNLDVTKSKSNLNITQ